MHCRWMTWKRMTLYNPPNVTRSWLLIASIRFLCNCLISVAVAPLTTNFRISPSISNNTSLYRCLSRSAGLPLLNVVWFFKQNQDSVHVPEVWPHAIVVSVAIATYSLCILSAFAIFVLFCTLTINWLFHNNILLIYLTLINYSNHMFHSFQKCGIC